MRRIDKLLGIIAASGYLASTAIAAPPPPPVITGYGPTADSVGYVQASGTDVINAQIGRWDTPYPFPDTGDYAGGLEPSGFSSFAINIDVNNGGLISFRYDFETYDAGIWDWLDIKMETPTGTIPIVEHLGKPGSAYGTYWNSGTIAVSQSLNQWRNQHVRFVFRVAQDGWGDQSAAHVQSFAITACDVPPITPLTDPVALDFEAGNTINTANLNAATSAGLSCMQSTVQNLGGSFSLSSAYRPPEYQTHLRQIWDGWTALRNRTTQECADLRPLYQAEFQRHGLLLSQQPASPSGPHTQGNAFDATIRNLPAPQTQDTVANGCGMHRPLPANDPVHFQPQ